MRRSGYKVKKQAFDYPFYDEAAPATLDQISPTQTSYEVSTLTYSGSGEVTGDVVAPTNTVIPATETPSSAAGCDAGDLPAASADEDQVALIQRGTCTFAQKVQNAIDAGYDAVIVFNEGNPGRTDLLENVTLGEVTSIPVVGVSYADGASLYESAQIEPTTVTVSTNTFSEVRKTWNVIADTRVGNPDKVIVVGAHLDSVLEGPGINDNGSGTATILETARQMSKLGIQPRQKVRFAFWGAEEAGLLGSEYYVDSLNFRQLGKVYANLNFDMLGSPNYVRFVYDGDGSADADAVSGPPGSAQIEKLFTKYFASQGVDSAPTAFDGRSDYGPFIAAGIPAGGLFSGAEGIKTEEEAAIYGGTAGEAYDSCYHQACDDITNLSTAALNEMGDAVAHAVLTLAKSRSGFYEDGSRMINRERQAVVKEDFAKRGSDWVK